MPSLFLSRALSLLELVSWHSIDAGTEISSRSRTCSEERSCIESELAPRKSTRAASAQPLLLLLPLFFFLPFVSLSPRRHRRLFFSLAVAAAARLSLSLFLSTSNQTKNTKLTTPSAVRVSRLARWSNWNTPSPREPVQRSSVCESFFFQIGREAAG